MMALRSILAGVAGGACTALVLAPIGEAGTAIVKRALFASNAGAVNGLHASKTPKAGQLLALGPSKKLPPSLSPASVALPRLAPGGAGAAGSVGPQGPTGAQGATGS